MMGSTPETPDFVPLQAHYPEAAKFIAEVSSTGGLRCIQITAHLSSPVAFLEIRDVLSDEQGNKVHVALEDLATVCQDAEGRRRIVDALWETDLFGNSKDASNNDSIECQGCHVRFPYRLPDMLPPNARTRCPVCRAEISVSVNR